MLCLSFNNAHHIFYIKNYISIRYISAKKNTSSPLMGIDL